MGQRCAYLVDLADGNLLDGVVLGDLTEDTTVTATDHDHLYKRNEDVNS
jgi:hypothetical protein